MRQSTFRLPFITTSVLQVPSGGSARRLMGIYTNISLMGYCAGDTINVHYLHHECAAITRQGAIHCVGPPVPVGDILGIDPPRPPWSSIPFTNMQLLIMWQ